MTTKHAPAPEGRIADLAATHTPPLSPDEIRTLTEPLTAEQKRRKADVVDIDGILADPGLRSSDRVMRTAVGTLRALGYDIPWLTGVTGLTATELNPPRRTVVPVEHMRMILTVATRIGDRPATPASTGLSREKIDAVQRAARRQHYFVPACYDERYTYIARSARVLERFADNSNSATAANKIRATALFMREGGTAGSIARRYGFSKRTWERTVQELGIRSVRSGGGTKSVVSPAPGQDALRAVAIDAVNALELGEDPMHLWTLLRADAEELMAEAATAADDERQDAAA